jgi:plastocyanin
MSVLTVSVQPFPDQKPGTYVYYCYCHYPELY